MGSNDDGGQPAKDSFSELLAYWARQDAAQRVAEAQRQAGAAEAEAIKAAAAQRVAALLAAGAASGEPGAAGEPRPANAASERQARRRQALAALLAEPGRRWTNKELLAALRVNFDCTASTLKADKRALWRGQKGQ